MHPPESNKLADHRIAPVQAPHARGPGPELLTPPEVAALLRISRATLYRLVESRRVPFYRIGGVLRLDRRDLVEYLARQRVNPIS